MLRLWVAYATAAVSGLSDVVAALHRSTPSSIALPSLSAPSPPTCSSP
jgi:hypothetical protein